MSSTVFNIVGFTKQMYWFSAKLDGGVSDSIVCKVCRVIPKEIFNLSCGDSVCKLCLEGMRIRKGTDKFKCCVCNSETDQTSVSCEVSKADLWKRRAQCPYQTCDFTATVKGVKRHVLQCEKQALVSCIHCKVPHIRCQLVHHTIECVENKRTIREPPPKPTRSSTPTTLENGN